MSTVKSDSNLLYEKIHFTINLNTKITLLFCFYIICQKEGPNAVMDFLCWDFHYLSCIYFLIWKCFRRETVHSTLLLYVLWKVANKHFFGLGHRNFLPFFASSKSLGCYTSKHSFFSFIFTGCKEFGIFRFRNWYRLTLTSLSMPNALQSSALECGEQSWILISLMKEGNTSDLLNSFKPMLQ